GGLATVWSVAPSLAGGAALAAAVWLLAPAAGAAVVPSAFGVPFVAAFVLVAPISVAWIGVVGAAGTVASGATVGGVCEFTAASPGCSKRLRGACAGAGKGRSAPVVPGPRLSRTLSSTMTLGSFGLSAAFPCGDSAARASASAGRNPAGPPRRRKRL